MNENLVEKISTQFGEKVGNFEEPYGLFTCTTSVENLIPLIEYLKQNGFGFLTDIAGVHFPDNTGGELSVVYHLHDLPKNIRIRVKVFVPKNDAHVPTLSSIFSSANWMERETFDFYGIIFDGHPNLKRILNIEDMDYHPMLKEYALEDATREDKIDALFGR